MSHFKWTAIGPNTGKFDPAFFLRWIGVTTLGVPGAFFLDLILMRIVTAVVGDYLYVNGVRHITEDYLYMYTFVPLVGVLLGGLQYGLLRRHLPRMGGWPALTTAGWLAGAGLSLLPGWLGWTSPVFTGGLALVGLGVSIGAAQWLLLRRRVPHAQWWLVGNVAGYGLAALLVRGDGIGLFELLLISLLPACATAGVWALWLAPTPSA